MSRESDFITEARAASRKFWELLGQLETFQREWNALDYGNTLADGVGENAGITRSEVAGVVLDVCNELRTRITNTSLGGNVAKLL